MQNRIRRLLSAVFLITMILSMAVPAFATEAEPATEPVTESTTEPITEHVHTWQTLSATIDMHIMICTTCDQVQSEPHTFNSEEICIVCGRYFHTHKWQRIKADSVFHTITCPGCGETKTVTHTMYGDICSVCGYETHTHTMQYVGGEVFPSEHMVKCTSCDAIGWEQHTFGSDDKCTVCGAGRPCEHQWTAKINEQYSGNHLLVCACGASMTEDHSLTWNTAGRYALCTICGLKDYRHCHTYFSPNGTHCIKCDYVKNSTESDSRPNGTEPAEAEPVETEPAETESVETEPTETESVETEPTETESVETEPAATNPTETASGEANSAETEASDILNEEDGKIDSRSGGSTLVWVVAIVSIAAGLTICLFLWKKKSS